MKRNFICIGKDIVLPTLLAITAEEQQTGLMYKEWPPPIMSFIYSYPSYNRFWMKNCPSPLDVVFSLDGIITEICKGEPHSTAMIGGNTPSNLIVELPFGSCVKLGVKEGDKISLLNPIKK